MGCVPCGAIGALSRPALDEVARLAAAGDLKRLKGVGDVTARCVVESLRGEVPDYLRRLEAEAPDPTRPGDGRAARRAEGRLPQPHRRLRRRLAAARDGGHNASGLSSKRSSSSRARSRDASLPRW